MVKYYNRYDETRLDTKDVWIKELQAKIKQLEAEVERLKKIKHSCAVQYKAAMRAKSLGLCKKVISHALTDIKALEE